MNVKEDVESLQLDTLGVHPSRSLSSRGRVVHSTPDGREYSS